MKPIAITPQMARVAGAEDVSIYEGLCLFDHYGKGYLVAPVKWNRGGCLPCMPGVTFLDAIRNWEKQRKERAERAAARR